MGTSVHFNILTSQHHKPNIVTMKFVLALTALFALSEGLSVPYLPSYYHGAPVVQAYAAPMVQTYAAPVPKLRGNGYVVAEGVYGPYVRYDSVEPDGYKQYHYGHQYAGLGL